MRALTREARRTLVEIGMAAAAHKFRDDALAIEAVLDLLVPDDEARALCGFCMFIQLDDAARAQASLAEHTHPDAERILQMSRSLPRCSRSISQARLIPSHAA